MITYSDIYEAARKERYSEPLQEIEEGFIGDVKNYLKEKGEIASKENDSFSEVIIKTKKQLENAVTLFKELMVRRRKKILSLVLIAAETGISSQDFENMLDFEKALFEDLMKSIEKSDSELNNVLEVRPKNGKKTSKVKFKEDVGEFLDLDGNKLGGFKEGEEIELLSEIALVLVNDNKAEVVE
jgi:DNA replication initiation complex subunit (GINS family)